MLFTKDLKTHTTDIFVNRILPLYLLCLIIVCAPIKADDHLPLSLLKESKHSLAQAHTFLMLQQQKNGSWCDSAPITAMVLYSIVLDPQSNFYINDNKTNQSVEAGFNFLKGFVQKNGGIYKKEYRNYITAVCLMAFAQTRDPKYKDIVKNAHDFLVKFQLDEGEGFNKNHKFYGGIGYGGDTRPDLSNTQMALDAIHEAELYMQSFKTILPSKKEMQKEEKELGLHWQKALIFLNRCQNTKYNKMDYATNDGGFRYETGTYKAERSRSYGSMTYAGVKSLVYANLHTPEMTEKVQKAFDWIQKHYTWERNPKLEDPKFKKNPKAGNSALYYYYMTASKALDAMKIETIQTPDKQKHKWRPELITKLISIQKADGHWINENGRFWENIPELTTAYAVIAQKFALATEFKLSTQEP